MTTIEPRQGTPEQLSTILEEEFENDATPIIVFAGPKLLDRNLADMWDRGVPISGPEFDISTDEATVEENPVPVIDEFYSEFERYADQETFQELVREGSVSLVVRPRRFDYLYTHTEMSEWIDINAATFIYARYRSQTTATEDEITAEEIANNRSEYDPKTISNNIEKLRYRYTQFEAEPLSDLPPYITYIPFLLDEPQFSDLNADGYLVPEVLYDFLTESGKAEVVSQFTSDLKATFRTLFEGDLQASTETLLQGGISASGLVATATGQPIIGAGAVIGYLGWQLYNRRGDGPETEELRGILGPLAAEYVPPHTQETLEAELELKPGTISAVQSLFNQPERLEQLLSFDPDRVDELESEIENLNERVATVNTALDDLEAKTTTFAGDALLELISLVEREIIRQQDELSTLGVDLDQITGPAGREPLRPELVEQVAAALDEEPVRKQSILVVKGARGVGKSSFLHELGIELRETYGYTTRVCNPIVVSTSPGRVAHEAAELTDDPPVALFYTFDGGLERSVLRHLFGSELAGKYDVLVIECVDSLYGELDAALSTSDHGRESTIVDQLHRARVQLPELESDIEDARSIGHNRSENPSLELQKFTGNRLAQIPQALGVTDSEQVERIVTAGDGNPLCTVEATLLSLADRSIANLSGQEVIRKRLWSVVNRMKEQVDDPTLIDDLMYASTVYGAAADLRRLLLIAGYETETERQTAEQLVRTTLRGYIRKVGGFWKLTPDVYCEILFDELWFARENVELETAPPVRQRYLNRLCDVGPSGFLTCSTRLGERWPAAEEQETPDVYNGLISVQEATGEICDYTEPLMIDRYCLQALIQGGVPLREQNLDTERLIQMERFWGPMRIITPSAEVISHETPAIVTLLGQVSKLLANHLYAEIQFSGDELDGISSSWAGSFTVNAIEDYMEQYDVDEEELLTADVGNEPGSPVSSASEISAEDIVTNACAWAFADVYKRTNYSTDQQWIEELNSILEDVYAGSSELQVDQYYFNYTGKAMSFIADSTPESEIRNSIDAVVSVGENREEDSPVGPYEFWVRLYGSVIIWIGESTSDHLSTWYTAVKEHIEENRENAGTIRTDIEARVGSSDVVMDEFRAVW